MSGTATPRENGSIRTRFKPGQSGNRKGRPKGSKNLSTLMAEALAQTVTIVEGDVKRDVTKREAIALTITQGAMKGNPKHIAALLKITGEGTPPPPRQQVQQSGVLVVPTTSRSIEEWERDHGEAAKGKPPPPEFLEDMERAKRKSRIS